MSLVEVESEISNPQPAVEIIEQPAKRQKFRFKAEGRPGFIYGRSSTPGNRIPLSLQISGYTGRVQIVMSCVTQNIPYKPHPHNLVGEHCRNGYYFHETTVCPENPVVNFPKMILQRVKRNEVLQELKIRETEQIDPFITGFDHKNDVNSINLNVIRLAVQVFLVNENENHFGILNPIVSNTIFDRKLNPDPEIYRLSHSTCYVDGGQDDIILLCTKINQENVRIKFYQLEDDKVIWEDYGTFHFKDVYNKTAICFKPPSYKNLNILKPVDVFIKLVVLSEEAESSPVKFQYLPLPTMSKKRTNPFVDQLGMSTKSQKLQNEIFQPLNVSITEPKDHLPAARLSGVKWPNRDLTKQASLPIKVPRLDTNCLLVDSTPSASHVPLPFNDSNKTKSKSKENAQGDTYAWNIPEEFGDTNVDVLDSASGITKKLDMDCNQIHIESCNFNSGDLNMTDVAQ